MKLTLKERFTILNVLPAQGNFTTMLAKSDLIERIKITQEEVKELQVENTENGSVKWNGEKDKEKEFEITELETKMIKESLENLDKEEKITDDTVLIFKKFNV